MNEEQMAKKGRGEAKGDSRAGKNGLKKV